MIYAPSLACTRQIAMEADVRQLIEGDMPFLHIDFMDGHNVPNLCANLDVARELKETFPTITLDAHLMVTNPEDYVDRCGAVGIDYLSFVPETARDPAALLREIRQAGMKPGIVINPQRTPEEFRELLPLADMVILMSIVPGGVRRPFDDGTYQKIRTLVQEREQNGHHYLISIDGGINRDNGRQCRLCGADVLILGFYAIFQQDIPIPDACRRFRSWIEA
ncbi:ribulose-phosphate 3-epimerase [Flavonifractor sp. HCP28S3_F3]|uniref:ribulose-phosphate 3-epimerase n=1 Tax=Flavonifractor sp. HCP28S3_F3 TaxID=3438939 RepID=UPI003F8C6BE2